MRKEISIYFRFINKTIDNTNLQRGQKRNTEMLLSNLAMLLNYVV